MGSGGMRINRRAATLLAALFGLYLVRTGLQDVFGDGAVARLGFWLVIASTWVVELVVAAYRRYHKLIPEKDKKRV